MPNGWKYQRKGLMWTLCDALNVKRKKYFRFWPILLSAINLKQINGTDHVDSFVWKDRFLWVLSFHWSTLRSWDGMSRLIQRNQSTAAVCPLEIWPCLKFLQKMYIKQHSDKKHGIRAKWKSQKSDCYSVQRRASNHCSTRQEMVPEATEFRFSVGVTRMDRIKNEYIRQRREVTLSLDMWAGGILGILREWCWRWSCQA